MNRKVKYLILHSAILLFIHVLYFNVSWSFGGENDLISFLNIIEDQIIGEKDSYRDRYTVINTSYSSQEILVETPHGTDGKICISNRDELNTLISLLDSFDNKHAYLLFDVALNLSTQSDSSFCDHLSHLENYVVPDGTFTLSQKSSKLICSFTHCAEAGYRSYDGSVSKMALFNEMDKPSLPMKMYMDVTKKRVRVDHLVSLYQGNILLKYIYPKYVIGPNEYQQSVFSLSEFNFLLASIGKPFYDQFINNRIIVVGNTVSDVHYTSVGMLPGSIILLNTYFSLLEDMHLIHWSWLVFALFAFMLLLKLSDYDFSITNDGSIKSKLIVFASSLLSISILATFLSLISSLLFGIHVTILPVVAYSETLKFIKKYK